LAHEVSAREKLVFTEYGLNYLDIFEVTRKQKKKRQKKKKERAEVCGFTLGFFVVLKMQN